MSRSNSLLTDLRQSWPVTWNVWHAMFMREMTARTMSDRMAWFWMIFEPMVITGIMIAIRALTMGGQHIAGADFIPWVLVGLMGFTLFRENMMRLLGAVDANMGLFTYRQVKPVDTVLVRGFLEFVLKSFIFLLFIVLGSLLKFDLLPHRPLEALFDWLSLWMLGLGAGILASAAASLVTEIGNIVKLTNLPLLIMSGVIFPLNYIPHQYQRYVLLNPIVHGLESLRLNFLPGYHSLNGIDLTYLWFWALTMLTLGLMLHLRFQDRLKAR
ncbi:ABC transporter permease [Salinicola sp. MIT1003]|uniref:ABC transporter permease n=1 Tax=Salinicola sp. MIT1003 TaxID=1882734 RepID=UPI0008DC9B98|nr:ABC transporter permease [Salinicola sp. MIT1003]OHZ00473.1 ABC transporter permease [Salinicola sp. MIT1003]